MLNIDTERGLFTAKNQLATEIPCIYIISYCERHFLQTKYLQLVPLSHCESATTTGWTMLRYDIIPHLK